MYLGFPYDLKMLKSKYLNIEHTEFTFFAKHSSRILGILPEKLVPLNESSTYQGFHLPRVDCMLQYSCSRY